MMTECYSYMTYIFLSGFVRSTISHHSCNGQCHTKIKSTFFFRKMDLVFYWVCICMHLDTYKKQVVDRFFSNVLKSIIIFFHLHRLIRYLYPTDQQLRTLAGVPKEKPKRGKHSENGKVGDVFHIPRNLDIQLESAKVTALDIVHLKYYMEYQWLLDFSLYASIVYTLTEVSVLINHCSSNTLIPIYVCV